MDHVSIIVQKEDFLRPDSYDTNNYYKDLRNAYNALPTRFSRYEVEHEIVPNLSVCGDVMIEPIRCMGNHNSDKSPAFPRMHNKFLVFTDNIEHEVDASDTPNELPYQYTTLGISDDACVWTGSYNLSYTATKSLENAVIIHNKDIAQAYFNEWGQITALSERLNWESEWCEPEWRIGT